MSILEWGRAFFRQAKAANDQERMQFVLLYDQARACVAADVDRALVLLAEARAIAERLGEHGWVLLFDHWRTQWLFAYRRDFSAARDVVVPAVVEARKPYYQPLQQRICIHESLISVYIGMDPAGYATQIGQALDFMEQQIDPSVECFICFQGNRSAAALAIGDLDTAQAAALRLLQLGNGRPTQQLSAYRLLCQVAYRREEWTQLGAWAASGEPLAQQIKNYPRHAELLLWQALAAYMSGDRTAAQRFYQAALTQTAQTRNIPDHWHYMAHCAYLERRGEYTRALDLSEQELAMLAGKGQHISECDCYIQCCRLRALIGLPTAELLEAARIAAYRLHDPAPVLAQLAAIPQIAADNTGS